MASIRFTPDDRDDRGFVKLAEPRSLADLLPTPASIQADARHPAQRPMSRTLIATQIGLGLALVALVAYLLRSGEARPARVPHAPATAAAVQINRERDAMPFPIPTTAPTLETVAGYWAPDGASAGLIDPAKIVRVVDVRGVWARVAMDGGGLVWTRTDAIPRTLLAAYTPPTAIPVPTEPPPPCAKAGIDGKMVQVCDYAAIGDLEARAKAQWIVTYGGNAGVVITPSPADWSRP